MRNLKKFLALVLAMMMTLSLMVTVNASSTFTDEDDVADEFTEAVWVLSGMGVFRGMDDGSFKPQGNVTRAQMAAVVYRLATGDAEDVRAHLYKEYANFSDVDKGAWYAGYVGYCSDAQIIKGYGDNTFKPEKEVTGYEALAMLLRAVGYDQNKEFQGADWKVKVGATATGEKLLQNVNNSNYAGTLNQVAKREMLAEITFQTAQIPTVVYRYGTYEKFQGLGINTLNESLGQKFYGLASQVGIVVANQETGETVTKLGVNTTGTFSNSKLTDLKLGDSGSYAYATYGKNADGTDASSVDPFSPTNTTANVTLNFKIDSGRDLFGHKAKIWYDSRSGQGSVRVGDANTGVTTTAGYGTTYALLDKATAATVYATAGGADASGSPLPQLNVSKDADKKSGGINKGANAAGFDSTKNAANADGTPAIQWSTEYSQFGTTALTAGNESLIHMYTVIDNTGNGGIDAIIRLNAEVAKITETNSTSVPKTLTLKQTSDKNGNKKDSVFQSDSGVGVLITSGDKNQILPNSVTTLGEIVTVWQVKKTSATQYVNTGITNANSDLFKLETLPKAVVGTVQSYECTGGQNANNVEKVVVTVDGQTRTIERSGILEGTKAIAYHTADGDTNPVPAPKGSNLRAGASYTFVLDELGRFLTITSPDTFGFIYTTYADFQDGGLGSANIDYKVYGVNWDGEKIVDRDIKILRTIDTSTSTAGTAATTISPTATPGTIAVDTFDGKSATTDLGYAYANDRIAATKKALDTNRVKPGTTTAYMIDEKGTLSDQFAYNGNSAATRVGVMGDAIQFCGWWGASGKETTWTISAADAANGFAAVVNNLDVDSPSTPATDAYNNRTYLLTTETRFLVVSGVGANMTVKEYKGIKELLGSSTSVVIDNAGKKNGIGAEVWFKTGDYSYDSIVTGNNRTITDVILSECNLQSYSAQNIYYSRPNNVKTEVQLDGAPGVTQFKLWLDGVEGTYWIEAGKNANGSGDIGSSTYGTFYTLSKVDEVNGVPIYSPTELTSNSSPKMDRYGANGSCNVGSSIVYSYMSVNEMNKATIGTGAAADIMDVSNAIVADVEYATIATTAGTRSRITDVETLNRRVSTNTSKNALVAIVNDGINVSAIYVINGSSNSLPTYP